MYVCMHSKDGNVGLPNIDGSV